MLKHKDWADAASRAVGAWPGNLGPRRDSVAVHAKSVWFGIVRENCPEIGLKDLSNLGGLGASAHSSCHACCDRWKKLPWRERYGWLLLADSMAGARNRQKAWAATDFSDGAVDRVRVIAAEVRDRQTSEPFRRINIPGHYDGR
jgi:hypothetical protein